MINLKDSEFGLLHLFMQLEQHLGYILYIETYHASIMFLMFYDQMSSDDIQI